MIDAVLSYHLNPQTCGVAKWNHALAKRLGVPCLPLGSDCKHPLISVKGAEIPTGSLVVTSLPFDLFMHDDDPRLQHIVEKASRMYVGNRSLADAYRSLRPDVIEAFCPSTVDGDPTRGAYRVLVFGMAHKILLPHFERLKAQLDREHPDYTIELSTAVHEGSPWDEALEGSTRGMAELFGPRLRVLGFLGDDALARTLQEVDAVAAYYVPALRANNTTAWAALEAGKTLYTNTDEHSPDLDPRKYSWEALQRLLV